MNTNPYAPPTAAVADFPTSIARRPWQIVMAVCLLWWVAVSSIVPTIHQLIFVRDSRSELQMMSLLPFVVGFLIRVALAEWVIGKISVGRNWARIVMLVFAVLGIAWAAVLSPAYWAVGIRSTVFFLNCGIETVALGLCFIGPGARWFAQRD